MIKKLQSRLNILLSVVLLLVCGGNVWAANDSDGAHIIFPPLPEQHTNLFHSSSDLRQQLGVRRSIDAAHSISKPVLQFQNISKSTQESTTRITSPGAKAIRIGLTIITLPDAASLQFSGERSTHNIMGKEINSLINANIAADSESADARTYWSPTLYGENAEIQITLSSDSSLPHIAVDLPAISHFTANPATGDGALDNCHNDVSCYKDWDKPGKATSKIVFTDSGTSYSCTGTLLEDLDTTTTTPYVITANHCVPSQTVASSLETLWNYQSSRCNTSTTSSDVETISGGAAYLWGKGMSFQPGENLDVSLLRLNNDPPTNVKYADWGLSSISQHQHSTIHHPYGDLKKISLGYPENSYDCWYTSTSMFKCSPAGNGNFTRINWSTSGTQFGSNGAGLFRTDKKLVGTLSGGSGNACSSSRSYYSNFAEAYRQGNLGQWLNTPGPEPPEPIVMSLNYLLLKKE